MSFSVTEVTRPEGGAVSKSGVLWRYEWDVYRLQASYGEGSRG